ncbi:hypothetical protein Tco_0848091 [Tanacetum coccineum]
MEESLTPKEPTFQVVLDVIALTPCYHAFLITANVPEVYMHHFWNSMYTHNTFYRFKIDKKKRFKLTLEVFVDIFQICLIVQGREFDPLPSEDETVSFLRELDHTGEINSLNDVVVDQMHQPWRTFATLINQSLFERLVVLTSFVSPELKSFGIYGDILPECLTSPTIKKSKAYKTYIGYATGKRVKRSVKKSSTKPAKGVVIREPPMETKSKGKEKEKVDVAHGKGIELLFEVALTEKAQLKEVRKKSIRDFHKTHPSGSGIGAEKPPSVEKITPTVTKASDEGSGYENESEVQESDSEQDEEFVDDNQEEEEVNQENESEDDEIKSDEDKGMDDTTDQFNDDVDARLEEPTQTGKEVVQGEGADVE